MHVCMYTCVCMHVMYVCMHVCMHVCMYACVCVYYICMYVCMYVCIHIYIYIYIYIYVKQQLQILVLAHVYVCTYIHIHAYVLMDEYSSLANSSSSFYLTTCNGQINCITVQIDTYKRIQGSRDDASVCMYVYIHTYLHMEEKNLPYGHTYNRTLETFSAHVMRLLPLSPSTQQA